MNVGGFERVSKAVSRYGVLSRKSKNLLRDLAQRKEISKSEIYQQQGRVPGSFAFVFQGLLSCSYTDRSDVKTINRFFAEGDFVACTASMVSHQVSEFEIQALEDTTVYEFSFHSFMNLVTARHDVALLYIRYLEKN